MSDAVAGQAVYADTLPPGCHWSFVMPRGHVLRLVDINGGANLGMLLYNPQDKLERLNIPDTLKCQHTFRLTTGHCLYSDMGRVFCAISADSFGWHDSVCGTCDRTLVETRWGKLDYQQALNSMRRNGRDGFLVELAKYGMGKRDMAANLNFFSQVVADDEGNLTLARKAPAGSFVELLFEMDTLVVMHTCPHPLDLSDTWPAQPVRYEIRAVETGAAAIDSVLARPENARGLRNNMLYHLGCSAAGCSASHGEGGY